MTVQLDWPPELVARLTEEARSQGLSLEANLLRTVLEKKPPAASADASITQSLAREAAGKSIRDLRKTNSLGQDLTIRDLIDEGRRF